MHGEPDSRVDADTYVYVQAAKRARVGARRVP
jgi:hypothetical protein